MPQWGKEIFAPTLNKKAISKRDKDWLLQMIKNGDSLYKTGDEIAIELNNKWDLMSHPKHEYLKDSEIYSIINYLKEL